MAGKKGKRKGHTTGDLSMNCFRRKAKKPPANINPVLVPSAAFTVVPRIPAPQPQPTAGLAGSQEVLNASLVGKPPQANGGQDDEPFSDPESSLYDFQVMEEPGYSSVEMLSASRKRRSMGDREPAQTPGPQHRPESDDFYEVQQPYDAAHIQRKPTDPSVLYSLPNKHRDPERGASPGRSMHSTQDVREAMRAVHDMSSEDDLRETTVHRQAEKPISARSLHFPVEHETGVKAKLTQQSSLTSPHAHKPHTREEPTQDKGEPVSAGRHPSRVASPDEPSMSARSARSLHSTRSISLAEDRVHTLEAEKEHLTTLTHQLETEVQSYREVVSTLETGDTETAQSLLAKKQVNDLMEENGSLKSSIHRLNVELSQYQAKYRPVKADQMGDLMGLPSKGPVPSWMLHVPGRDSLSDHPIVKDLNIRYLNPLFLAYDDRLREREDALKHSQAELEHLRQRTRDIIQENEQLHSLQEQSGSRGPVDVTEWEQMRENARLILEENQNLLEQINVKDDKAQDLHQAHIREVGKLTKQLVLSKAEKTDADQELEELRQKFRDLKQQTDRLVLDSQGHVTQDDHIRKMAELKRDHSDREEASKQEIGAVKSKLEAVQVERKTLANQVVDISSENRRLQAEVRAMHKSVRKAQQKMMLLQRAIEQSENKEMSVQDYLGTLIKVAEKNAFERDTYEKAAKEQEVERKRAMRKLLHGSITVGKMEEKLKLYKMKAQARISTVAERLKDQDEMFNRQKKEYDREMTHLRIMVKDKGDLLQTVYADKRQVEEELEAMWQAANSENTRIRDEMHKHIQKLRQHTGLSDAIDAHDKLESVYLSEDDEIIS